MVADSSAPNEPGRTPHSRRELLLEIAGVALVLAVPAGVIFATAQPIPNLPNRRQMAIEPEERTEVEQTQRELVQDRRRDEKKQDAGGRKKKDK
jgi:hypothetical protein